jgi:hypothetical protein
MIVADISSISGKISHDHGVGVLLPRERRSRR